MTHLVFKLTREALGLNQSEAARLLRVNPRTLERWESGKEPLPPERLDQLADFLTEIEAVTQADVERVHAMLEERMAPDGSTVALVVYMTDGDYTSVSWHGGPLPTAKLHRRIVFAVYQSLEAAEYCPVLVRFDRQAYINWLGDRADNEGLRSAWAAEEALR